MCGVWWGEMVSASVGCLSFCLTVCAQTTDILLLVACPPNRNVEMRLLVAVWLAVVSVSVGLVYPGYIVTL